MRKSIEVQGARQNNLQNIDVTIPRDQITVITGVSGSGKSTLAFEVIFGEGQRRFLDSLSTYAKSRVAQLKKPDVDFVFGLSPVIAIEQKKGLANPRSTVGTMTDIYDYLRLLYSTVGDAHCPICGHDIEIKSIHQIAEKIMGLPPGTDVRLLAPVQKIYNEDYAYLFDEIRNRGYRHVLIDGEEHDIGDEIELDEFDEHEIIVVADRFPVHPEGRKALVHTVENALKTIGEGFLQIEVPSLSATKRNGFYKGFGCPEHHMVMGELQPWYFTFNDPESACWTCSGIGSYRKADSRLVVLDPEKSLNKGAVIPQMYNRGRNWSYRDVMMYSIAKKYGFSLDTPWQDLPEYVRDIIFYGTDGEKIEMVQPAGAKKKNWITGRTVAFGGFLKMVERWYKRWSKNRTSADTAQNGFFDAIMTEYVCPDCEGKRLKKQRFCVTLDGRDIHSLSSLQLTDLLDFFKTYSPSAAKRHLGLPIIQQLTTRLELLIDIGLGYLSISRRSDTISGGEAQRIRLSTQISSGLMGMLYVLDEPSIGLHARDGERIITTLRKLRDIGNTIIIVEHDMTTIKSADHLVEMGPGPGDRGGTVVAEGSLHDLVASPESPTGRYLLGDEEIPVPERRRTSDLEPLFIAGAAENNLQNLDVEIPLGLFVCVTGVSGSGKSSLVHEILFKALKSIRDPRILPGKHELLTGQGSITNVININQAPIGRSSRSNPATYVGLFDRIRKNFAASDSAVEKGFTFSDFSFNAKSGGRCEECLGEGKIVTQLQFMPDIETVCPVCKGKRFNEELLSVELHGKNIAQVLETSIEDALSYFEHDRYIHHKLKVLNDLGLGYLKLGQPSTTLSGGEAQRIKLATELGKIKRGAHNLYILDEPTTGLHLADIARLLDCLNRLVDAGHTVLVIEHHLDVIKSADHIIDLGPEGGKAGGNIVATGTPEEICLAERSITGEYLKTMLAVEESSEADISA